MTLSERIETCIDELEAWARENATENTGRLDDEAEAAQAALTILAHCDIVVSS